MSDYPAVRYTAACPRCLADVEWQETLVVVNSPAYSHANRSGLETRYTWRGCPCPDHRTVA